MNCAVMADDATGARDLGQRVDLRVDALLAGEVALQHPDGELPVGEAGLDAAAVAGGQVDLPLVAAVLPLLDEVLPRAAAPEAGVEADPARTELDADVV